MSRVLMAPYTNILNSQVIQDHVDVLQTYSFELKPSEIGIINVVNNLAKGINLFELYKFIELENEKETESCCSKLDAPAGTFFMVESVGSSNAEIIELDDRENRYNGTAPVKLRMSQTITMEYKTDQNKSTDILATYRFVDKSTDFLDEEFADNFCPPKKTKIKFDINLIDLDGTNPKGKKFLLAQDGLSLMTTAESIRVAMKDPSLDYPCILVKKQFDNVIC